MHDPLRIHGNYLNLARKHSRPGEPGVSSVSVLYVYGEYGDLTVDYLCTSSGVWSRVEW